MEHYNKYYLVKASEFDNRRARPRRTSYGEQRRHDIEQSYKDILRELAAQSALTKGVQEWRRQVLPRIPDKPPSQSPRQTIAEESEEEAAGDRARKRNSR